MAPRPNIVIFNPDQWRGDVLGHVGNPAAVTPNLDAFAATEGVSFSRAFCQNPVCTPSRCSFMSGWYPHVAGHRTMHHMMRPHEPVMLKTLKDNGYFVWWGGKNDLVPAQNGYGAYCDARYEHRSARPWDESWRGEPGSDAYYSFFQGMLPRYPHEGEHIDDHDWGTISAAVEAIENRPKDRPFCLFLALHNPHPPYGVEEPYFGMTDRAKVPARAREPEGWRGKPSLLKGMSQRYNMRGWSEERWRELRAVYYGMCAKVDAQFGLLMWALKKAGVYDDTAVFLFSDHGDFAGDYGLVEKTQNTFEDCLTRVPLLVKPSRGAAVRPRVSDALVELVDVPATIEALTGIAPKHTHFGRSLLPVIAGETDAHRDAVFAEGGRLLGERHCMELESRQTPDKLYWVRASFQMGEGPEHGKAVMCRTRDWKYVRRLYETDELYDLAADPGEVDNRIDDPACAGVLSELKERTTRFYMETADAVPHGADSRG